MAIPVNASHILGELAKKDAHLLNLLTLCRKPDYQHIWSEGPELPRRFARLLLKQGHPTFALEVASRCLVDEAYPNDPDLLYCRALALARGGNPTRADMFVQEMLNQNNLPLDIHTEVLSLAGRIRKDLALRTADPRKQLQYLKEAFDFYKEAFDLSGSTFPGINAATLCLLIGDIAGSREIAETVKNNILDHLNNGDGSDYWLLATLGEACLLLGDFTAAMGSYAQAVRLARENHSEGDIAAMLRQLRLLQKHISIGPDLLSLFRLGPVVVFAGHGIDRPGLPLRLPADKELESLLKQAIANELDALETHIGYCIPGAGSELFFGELMRERNAELHFVLPYDERDFILERVTYGAPEYESWKTRYENLKGFLRIPVHSATTEEFLGDQILHDFAGSFMQGLALNHARQLETAPVALVVADRLAQEPSTGLASFITKWQETGHELRIIDLAALRTGLILNPAKIQPHVKPKPVVRPHRSVKSMLFADVAGFSGLPEAHLPAFFIEFLKQVMGEVNKTKKGKILFQNTWGDGLYLVFQDVLSSADFSLRLLERMENFDFTSYGFSEKSGRKSGIRIGLHTGPVFEGEDAIISRKNYFGSHVSRAARIEPVTTPGCAFVSEQFAAILAMTPGHSFICEFLGLQPLAKNYDDKCPLYRLTVQ